jgi:hypothetical protein
MAQGVGSEFKPQYHKKKKRGGFKNVTRVGMEVLACNPSSWEAEAVI